jgi:hypothetical protein
MMAVQLFAYAPVAKKVELGGDVRAEKIEKADISPGTFNIQPIAFFLCA